ncbi:MAG: DUF1934 domain-containing protein [Eubacterium sp.]|nr:DUF1934 domain-containing protein [Eubacterium sp.]
MKKEAKITVNTRNSSMGNSDFSVVSFGSLEEIDDCIIIEYEDVSPDETHETMIKNTIKIAPGQVDIIKDDAEGTHMIFIMGENTVSYYSTPYGILEFSVHTTKISVKKNGDELRILLCYGIQIESDILSKVRIDLKVKEVNNVKA